MAVFGLIVAGTYDEAILKALAQRIRPDLSNLLCRQCQDDRRVTRFYRTFLEEFKAASAESPVDKAIVIRDAHRKVPAEVERTLKENFDPTSYPFPVHFVVVVPEPEAWLLADSGALTSISAERGVHTPFEASPQRPEELVDPKRDLCVRLGKAKVSYTQVTAERLAELANPDLIERCCPSFANFRAAVEGC